MVLIQRVKGGFQSYRATLDELLEDRTKVVLCLFTGSKGTDGKSWCPDCVVAEPIIHSTLKSASDDTVLLEVEVGDIPTWKDPQCKFRTGELRLKVIPTLLKCGSLLRLEERQCCNVDLIEMLLEE